MIINSEDFAKIISFAYKKGFENAAQILTELGKNNTDVEEKILKAIKEAFKDKIAW